MSYFCIRESVNAQGLGIAMKFFVFLHAERRGRKGP